MIKTVKKKTTKWFLFMLALMSIIGLVSNALNYWGFVALEPYVAPIINMILGIALILEAGAFTLLKIFKDGRLDLIEATHVVTALVGLLVLTGGFIALPFIGISLIGTPFGGIIALANAVAAIFVLIQMLVV